MNDLEHDTGHTCMYIMRCHCSGKKLGHSKLEIESLVPEYIEHYTIL